MSRDETKARVSECGTTSFNRAPRRRDATHISRVRGGVRSVRAIDVRGARGEARIGTRRATKRLDL